MVHLKLQQKYNCQWQRNAGTIKLYVCNRGGVPKSKKQKNTNTTTSRIDKQPQQYSTARYCGCTFYMKAFTLEDK